MNWHETIQFIQNDDAYKELVHDSYLGPNLVSNVRRFMESVEFKKTLELIKAHSQPEAKRLLDIGAGNGISSASFALNHYHVTALEPDPSDLVGAGAINTVMESMGISTLEVIRQYAESIDKPDGFFDIVYARQAMHHAHDLHQFVSESARVLKPGGLLITIRDHVIYDRPDKEVFLKAHPLQKFYGGENAFTVEQYTEAMSNAGLKLKRTLKYFDSPINYFPMTEATLADIPNRHAEARVISLRKKIGPLAKIPLLQQIYSHLLDRKNGAPLDEKRIPGRMYSFIAIKA